MKKLKEKLANVFRPLLPLGAKIKGPMGTLTGALLSNFSKIISAVLGLAVLWFIFYACSKGLFDDEGKIKVTTSLGDKYYID